MGTVKIELDLPNFEKEIELKVIINKDGVQSSTPLIDKKVNTQCPDCGNGWRENMSSQISTKGTEVLKSYGSSQSVSCYVSPGGPISSSVTQAEVQSQNTKASIPSSMMGTF